MGGVDYLGFPKTMRRSAKVRGVGVESGCMNGGGFVVPQAEQADARATLATIALVEKTLEAVPTQVERMR